MELKATTLLSNYGCLNSCECLFWCADLDFNSTSYFVTIEPGMDQVTLSIEILQDEVSEWQETFLLYLSHVTQQMDEDNEVPVTFKQDVSIVRIKQSGK